MVLLPQGETSIKTVLAYLSFPEHYNISNFDFCQITGDGSCKGAEPNLKTLTSVWEKTNKMLPSHTGLFNCTSYLTFT